MTSYSSDSRVDDLADTIMELRQEYKELVTELYTNDPLLHDEKEPYDFAEIDRELKGYYDMIGHCLMIGDSDILYHFGINPLYNDITLLSGYDDLQAYIKSFEDEIEKGVPEGRQFYLEMLIRAFEDLNRQPLDTSRLSVDQSQL